jgi:nucleoside-diphosphate-sugar epimerase
LGSASNVPSGEVFFLAGDGVLTYHDLVTTIAERLNCDPLKIVVPNFAIRLAATGLSAFGFLARKSVSLNLDKMRDFLPDYWICSNQKAKNHLGFLPEFDLSGGIANAITWYKKNKWL